MVSHYSGELPEVRQNSEKASEVVSMEIASESPQHQSPNQQMTTTTSPEQVSTTFLEQIIPEYIVPEHYVPGQILTPSIPETVSEPDFMTTSDAPNVEIEQSSTMIEKSVPGQPSTSNTQTTNSIYNQPSSSHLAIVPTAPPKPT
jgi:hypothetical protein